MKHGIYYALWEQEWKADYIKYIEKVSKLGFDVLGIAATPLVDYSDKQPVPLFFHGICWDRKL
jgi:D-psicose/D-tagatose/L-ribulose 3-epimerase